MPKSPLKNYKPIDFFYLRSRDMTVFYIEGVFAEVGGRICIQGECYEVKGVEKNSIGVPGNQYDKHMRLRNDNP